MPIYTYTTGSDTLGPLYYLRLTTEGRTRIIGTINQEADAKQIAQLLNDTARRAESLSLTTGAPIQTRRRTPPSTGSGGNGAAQKAGRA